MANVPVKRDIDEIAHLVRSRVPEAAINQIQVKYPGVDDDGIWTFERSDERRSLQIESSSGMCPFLIERDGVKRADALWAHTVPQTVEIVVSSLRLLSPP